MNFLFPQFLFGLFALSIPIIIHLFNFRRTKKVYFSSTQFLKNVKEASSSKLKLKHLLILVARLLFIAFLVLAFAQPILRSELEGLQNDNVVIYLDNSHSMSNEVDEGQVALDAAVAYVNEIIELYPPQTKYILLTNDFAPFSNVAKSKSEIADLTTELSYSATNRELSEVLKRMTSHGEFGVAGPKDIFWISDFQKTTTESLAEIANDSTNTFHLVPLSFLSTSNVTIDSVYLNNPFIMASERVVLNIRVRNYGLEDINDLLLTVYANDNQAASASVDIKPLSFTNVSFDLGFSLDQISKCRVTFEEYPVTFDNDFYFTLNKANRISVIELKSNSEPSIVEQVYGNSSIFNFSSYNIANFDYSRINSADLIILNELDRIDPSLSIALNDFKQDLGSIMLIPAEAPDLASYQSLVGSRRLRGFDSAAVSKLSVPNFDNPFYEDVFESRAENLAMPDGSSMISWGPDREALLQLNTGQPFLSRFRGSGYLYLLASPLNDNFTSFHRHALFVPVMYKIASSSLRSGTDLYYSLNEPVIKLKLDSLRQDAIFKLISDGIEVIPSQRIVGNDIYLEPPKYEMQAGFYDLFFQTSSRGTLSFNNSRDESQLDQYQAEELEGNFSSDTNVVIFESDNAQAFSREVKEKYLGVPLWKYALILALIFLLAEILLIRFL